MRVTWPRRRGARRARPSKAAARLAPSASAHTCACSWSSSDTAGEGVEEGEIASGVGALALSPNAARLVRVRVRVC